MDSSDFKNIDLSSMPGVVINSFGSFTTKIARKDILKKLLNCLLYFLEGI